MKNTASTDAAAITMAIGRILRMASRPTQPGDVAEYYRCRGIILDSLGGCSPERRISKPLPGWNFGSGNSGVIE